MSGNVSIRVICLQYKVYILILSWRSVFVAKTVLCLLMCVQVIPCMMTVIRTDDNAFRDFLFQQLGFLIGIVKQHIRSKNLLTRLSVVPFPLRRYCKAKSVFSTTF